MMQIKYKDGQTERVRLEVEVSGKAIYRKELMTEEYVLLTFNTAELVNLQKGDYIDTEFGRFLIVHLEKPKRNVDGDGGRSYEQKFHAPWERWTTRKLFYARQRGAEKAWSMTQKPEYFMQIVIDNLQAAGYGEFAADIDASLTEMKLVQFDGDSIVAGLNKIAEAWETEWWVTDNVIHLSKCEHGTPVGFEEGDLIRSMTRSDGQANDYITRLYAFGSTRNIPTNYRKSEDAESVIESVVERRLKLPEGTDHIDAWPNLRDEDVVEGVAIFEEVYPRRTGKCENITTEIYRDELTDDEHPDGELVEWNAYRFKDYGIKFKSEYILPDEELRLTFQSGALAGMDFAVVFNPDGADESKPEAQVWEIVRNDTYGIDLPNDKFHPAEGDEYILYGYDTKMVSDILIPRAEQELMEEAQKFLAKKSVDSSVYTCETDKIRCAGYNLVASELVYDEVNVIDLELGQRIELRSKNYFGDKGSRLSRVRAFEKRLDNKFAATYEVGESAIYSHRKELDQKVESLTVQDSRILALGGGVYLIGRYDFTKPSDSNAYSALRSKLEFLSKNSPDRAKRKIVFDEGIDAGDYAPGVRGGTVDGDGNAELLTLVVRLLLSSPKFVDGFAGEGWRIWLENGLAHLTVDKLTVRQIMTVFELLIEKIRSVGGQICVSAANGKIKDVKEADGYYIISFEQDNSFVVGDLMRCATFKNGGTDGYWVEITDVSGDSVTVPADEFAGAVPKPGDECVLMGNTKIKNRQNLILISATEDGQPRIDVLDGVSAKNFAGCLRARFGNLDGISDTDFPADNQPHGDGLYSDNAYLRGTFLLSTGEDIKTKFEIVEGRITSAIDAVRADFTADKSYLSNPTFASGMEAWSVEPKVDFLLAGGKWILANGGLLSRKYHIGAVDAVRDGERHTVHIESAAIVQTADKFKSIPTFEPDGEGMREAMPVYLTFFYRCVKPGKLTVSFDNVDKDGFKNFNSMYIEEELVATDGYVQYVCAGLWNGTGNFRLAFTGGIYVSMLILSTDKAEVLTHKYHTLFEQSEKLVRIAAQNFDRDGKVLEESGIVTTSRIAGLYAIGGDGRLHSFVGAGQDGIKMRADSISLEGLVTANSNFKILEDGSMEAASGTFSGSLKTLFVRSEDCDASDVGGDMQLNKDLKIVTARDAETFLLPCTKDYIGSRVMICNPVTMYSRMDQTTTIRTADGRNILGIKPTDGTPDLAYGQEVGVASINFLSGVVELVCIPADIAGQGEARWCVLSSSAAYLTAPKSN